jgi:hypothetical protein
MNGLTPAEREAEGLAVVERQFAAKRPAGVLMIPTPQSIIVSPVPPSDEKALPLGADLAAPIGIDVAELL